MTELLHNGDTDAPDSVSGPCCIFRRAGKIILASEQEKRTYFSIDCLDPTAQIAVDPELLTYSIAGGRAVFAVNCAPCHGAGGQGAPGFPILADDNWLWGGDIADIDDGDGPQQGALDGLISHHHRGDDPGLLFGLLLGPLVEHRDRAGDEQHDAAHERAEPNQSHEVSSA